MAAIVVELVRLRPRWREDEAIIAVLRDSVRRKLPTSRCDHNTGVNDSAIKEGELLRGFMICNGHGEYSLTECNRVDPGQRPSVALALVRDNAQSRLCNDGMSATLQFRQQGGFASARAAGNHHEHDIRPRQPITAPSAIRHRWRWRESQNLGRNLPTAPLHIAPRNVGNPLPYHRHARHFVSRWPSPFREESF